MFFTESSYLGIDPTAGRKPFAYAALDNQLHLTALGTSSLDDVLALMAGQSRPTSQCVPLAALARA